MITAYGLRGGPQLVASPRKALQWGARVYATRGCSMPDIYHGGATSDPDITKYPQRWSLVTKASPPSKAQSHRVSEQV